MIEANHCYHVAAYYHHMAAIAFRRLTYRNKVAYLLGLHNKYFRLAVAGEYL